MTEVERLQRERDALAGQVAALTEALGDCYEVSLAKGCTHEEACGWIEVHARNYLVNDIAAAAKARDDRIRAEARESMCGAVKPLPRDVRGGDGWTLDVSYLEELGRLVQADGWDYPTAEVTEIIALAVERRVLSALTIRPAAEVRKEALEEAIRRIGTFTPQRAALAEAIRALIAKEGGQR